MAEPKRTWVRQSVNEAKLHATAERQQSVIAGWTRLRVLVAFFGQPLPNGSPPKQAIHEAGRTQASRLHAGNAKRIRPKGSHLRLPTDRQNKGQNPPGIAGINQPVVP